MYKTFAISEVVNLVLLNLNDGKLSSATINHYRQICGQLARFCSDNQIDYYSPEDGNRFIESKISKTPSLTKAGLKRVRTLVDRLNCIVANSEWEQRKKQPKWKVECANDSILAEYRDYLLRTSKTDRNISVHMLFACNFLSIIKEQGCINLNELSHQMVLNAFNEATSKSKFRDFVSHFLKYLFSRDMISADLTAALPTMARHKGVPSVYTPEEAERILLSFDRSATLGKRDFACALIAARLGLRVSDIAELKFDNIRRTKNSVELVQVKTRRPIILPLLDEVAAAIDDYVNNARPNSDDKHIFLQFDGTCPVTSTSVSAAIVRAFNNAGIESNGRKKGAHALRASLAAALLSEGNSYAAIQKTLGHKDIQNVTYYAKTEIEKLRRCALPVPVPTGIFLEMMAGGLC